MKPLCNSVPAVVNKAFEGSGHMLQRFSQPYIEPHENQRILLIPIGLYAMSIGISIALLSTKSHP
jgi:hypothetical protein